MMNIWTDGACRRNPGIGGWAFYVEQVGCWKGNKENTTNNEMELLAIKNALNWAKENSVEEVTIHSDSQYCISGCTQWLDKWVKNHWRTASNSSIKNLELWREIHRLLHHVGVTFVKVKAHSGSVKNDYVDKKAKEAMDKLKK